MSNEELCLQPWRSLVLLAGTTRQLGTCWRLWLRKARWLDEQGNTSASLSIIGPEQRSHGGSRFSLGRADIGGVIQRYGTRRLNERVVCDYRRCDTLRTHRGRTNVGSRLLAMIRCTDTEVKRMDRTLLGPGIASACTCRGRPYRYRWLRHQWSLKSRSSACIHSCKGFSLDISERKELEWLW